MSALPLTTLTRAVASAAALVVALEAPHPNPAMKHAGETILHD